MIAGMVAQRVRDDPTCGLDATTGELVDLLAAGIVDPTKVVRIALENAVSVAGTLLLAETTVTEHEVETKEGGAHGLDEQA